jgi:CheY-like chemotaxis protein
MLADIVKPMKTILVVEDFVAVQQFLREMLESKGYRTLGATDGNKAYEVLLASPSISLVLTDYHMPNCDGHDFLKKVRANSDIKHIPVIFLTAEGKTEIIKQNTQLGYSAWIKKPYRAETLFKEIDKVFLPSKQWSLF